MRKKISRVAFALIMILLMVSCKNTKQKLQEFVTTYNASAANFKAANVTLTTARGYINDNKIELRFETGLELNEANKVKANTDFPALLKDLINKDQNLKELIDEGVEFHAYYLASDNTVLLKEIVNKQTVSDLLK